VAVIGSLERVRRSRCAPLALAAWLAGVGGCGGARTTCPPPTTGVAHRPEPASVPLDDVALAAADFYKVILDDPRIRVLLATFGPRQREPDVSRPEQVLCALTPFVGRLHAGIGSPIDLALTPETCARLAARSGALESASDQEQRVLVIETRAHGPYRNSTEQGAAPGALESSPDIYVRLLETSDLRVLRGTWHAKQRDTLHSHPAYVAYALTGVYGAVDSPRDRAPVLAPEGTIVLHPPVSAHRFENLSEIAPIEIAPMTDVRILLIELKRFGGGAAILEPAMTSN
jgi:hypothetical protein